MGVCRCERRDWEAVSAPYKWKGRRETEERDFRILDLVKQESSLVLLTEPSVKNSIASQCSLDVILVLLLSAVPCIWVVLYGLHLIKQTLLRGLVSAWDPAVEKVLQTPQTEVWLSWQHAGSERWEPCATFSPRNFLHTASIFSLPPSATSSAHAQFPPASLLPHLTLLPSLFL